MATGADAERAIRDRRGRALRDLRISVTDRCNFRCVYCMPKEVFGTRFHFLPRNELLTFEEIARVARIFVQLGVDKIRLTGGEPLLRRQLDELVARLAAIPGVRDLAMTTNGALLTEERALALKRAGLKRVTISLDALDDETFQRINDVGFPVSKVLAAIAAAEKAGLQPIKINMVVKRGWNDQAILPMAEYFRGTPHVLRFIEYMDVGTANRWQMDEVVSGQEILDRIASRWPLVPVTPDRPGEVARRWRYADGQGEIGIIASVTQPFCSSCTRARLSPEGQLFTCLFGSRGFDLRALLRAGADDEALKEAILQVWGRREDRYSELRASERAGEDQKKIEMFRIGG